MKKIKKLLVTFLMTGIMVSGFSGVALAAENDTVVQPSQETLTYENNETNLTLTDLSEAGTAQVETTSDDQNLEVEISDVVEDESPAEEIEVPEGFEIYIDEQGEISFIEIEPEKEVVEEAEEVAEQEETEEKEEKPSYSEKDLRLLASLVYAEAGNQSYNGMLAVANVVLNRAKSEVYYHVDTVKEVIYDKKWSVQFAVTIKSKKTGLSMLDKALKAYDTGKFSGANPAAEKKAMNKAIKAAKAALQGENNIGDYLCFNAVNKYTYKIKNKYSDYKILGDHIFYRTK